MSLITDTVLAYLPTKRKHTPSGWTSFNAVCCHHNGTTQDHRQRGGIIVTNDTISYSCFNCGFRASWQPSRLLSAKFKKLLRWLNVPDDVISKCGIEALRFKEVEAYTGISNLSPTFVDKNLPEGAQPIKELIDNPPTDLIPILEYILSRGLFLDDYNWYWSSELGFKNRLIIPFTYKDKIVGYTARSIRETKLKYISDQQPGYVFNLDAQTYDKDFVIVSEGPMDAISIGGIALVGSEIKAGQKTLIDQLQKEVIVVPDRDSSGQKIIEEAIDAGWSVSFPDWEHGIKDINEAVKRYGRLYTLYSIITASYSMPLKIRLHAKMWYKDEESL